MYRQIGMPKHVEMAEALPPFCPPRLCAWAVRFQAGPGASQLGQRESAPGPCRRGCGDETWSAVIRLYDGHPSADSRGTKEDPHFPQLSSQGGIGRGATSSEEETALPVHRYGGDPR